MTSSSGVLPCAWLAAGLAAAAPCLAATPVAADGLRYWPAIAVSAPVGKQVEIRADGLLETTSSGAKTGLNLVRVIVLRRASERVMVGGGYTLVHGVTGSGAKFVEHRALQELNLRLLGEPGSVSMTSRTRLEERHRPSNRGLALRLRHQMRVELPLAGGPARAVLWNEYFHNINETAWSGAAGPGFMLTFVGVRVPVTQDVAIEPGYLNRVTFRSAHGRFDHIGAVTVGIRF